MDNQTSVRRIIPLVRVAAPPEGRALDIEAELARFEAEERAPRAGGRQGALA